ncbi:ADP-ribosylation factor GTPase-activating protein agd4 [Ranunculus cassubicifolius]
MSHFIKLEDSPMFRKQLNFLGMTTDELKERCQRLSKGCKKYVDSLGEACDADIAFADSLEEFGGGRDDPVSVAIGGPVLSKFITTFRELGTYKELLRSQVEHMLTERLTQFMSDDLNGVKDSRRRFDKATHVYDQAREKFMSLKKGAREDVVAELEEDLQNSKSSFERSRFNLVNALTNIESKKKYEFLESFSAIMDAHMRYYKQGYELLSQIEPFVHQLLTYAQQSKEVANVEQDKLAKRIQEYRTQVELESLRASSCVVTSTRDHGLNMSRTNSYKNIEALMVSASKGEVQTIKQGYLLKRSSSLRGDWKRRFFVLDSQGTLFYYRNKATKPAGLHSHHATGTSEHVSGVLSRFRGRHRRASSLGEENLGCHTVNLRMSTIKIDAEHTDLRLCFRIISPIKTYTLQAENEADRLDWVDKIRGVIASLLNSPYLEEDLSFARNSDGISHQTSIDGHLSPEDEMKFKGQESVSKILRGVPGNDICAECGASEPDWASLNLGILLCIECSGLHRNLGVHISKVRSLTLDVKVWEPPILDLFRNLGNNYCNSLWEGLLQNQRTDAADSNLAITKPVPKDPISHKERYIHSKYADKLLVIKETNSSDSPSCATRIWEAVKTDNIQAVYHLIVTSDSNIINTIYDEVDGSDFFHSLDTPDSQDGSRSSAERKMYDPTTCARIKDSSGDPGSCLQGCSLLHLACHVGDIVMLELLLQFGIKIDTRDFHGRTPLHHCISKRNNLFAKYLLRRGARSSVKDGGGLTVLERAMEMGAITDEQLFILLTKSD